MAGAAAMSIIKFLGNAAGLGLGIAGMIPSGPTPDNPGGDSFVTIAVGLDGASGLSNAGGNVPNLREYIENGDYIGAYNDPFAGV
jgi:hypothetical protein